MQMKCEEWVTLCRQKMKEDSEHQSIEYDLKLQKVIVSTAALDKKQQAP